MSEGNDSPREHATVLDRTFQVAYKAAYQVMRVYFRVKRPETHGALVTLWHDGEVLLVRNSYVPYYSLPGGYVNTGEDGRAAAVRELTEEIGFHAEPESLTLVVDVTHDWEGKRDHVQIFSIDVEARPVVRIDHREVIDATWFEPSRALELNLFPPLRTAIERRVAASK